MTPPECDFGAPETVVATGAAEGAQAEEGVREQDLWHLFGGGARKVAWAASEVEVLLGL